MANTGTQAEQVRDLLVELLESYNPTLNLAPGGAIYDRVVAPLYASLDVDPFDTDLEAFLLTRLRQEFPSLPAEQGDAIVDIVIRPLQLLLEGFKRELQIIRTGQSVRNSGQMRIQDAEDLAANFFVSRRTGSRASGTARLFFSNPTFVSLLASTEIRTASGLIFHPRVPQFFRPEVMAAQRSGQQFYLDVGVLAEEVGEEYNIEEGEISSVSGVSSAIRATNRFAFTGGSYEESAGDLLQRTRTALTERSLNTRRGVRARLFNDFPTIRNMEVVGFGDPEMARDVITGSGGGDVVTSGMSFVLGRYVLLLSMFENKGRDGTRRIRAGGRLELNFWNFLYGTAPDEANKFFTVEEVVYESSEDLEGVPTIYLLKLDASPDVEAPSISAIPGLLPGVFAAAYDRAEIRISDIPGGITNPDASDGQITVLDGEVHIGGHYDVYVRPSASSSASSEYSPQASEVSVYEGEELTLSGEINAVALKDYGALKNKVHSRLRLNYRAISGTFIETEVVHFYDGSDIEEDTGAYLLDLNTAEKYMDLCCLTSDNEWTEGQVKGADSGAIAAITSVEQLVWADVGVTRGMTLDILTGPDSGVYKILDVRGVELVLDLDLTVLAADARYRIIDETVVDAFSPRSPVYPFNADAATGLSTSIGVATVRVADDLLQYGVAVGQTFEILDGDNQGVYQILDFGPNGGRSPILSSEMRASDSNGSFVVYNSSGGLTRPLVRVAPGGVALLDSSGQDTGYTVPPALPVGAVAFEGFSGARATRKGLNGFVLADAGTSWAPESHTRLVAYDVDSETGEVSNPTSGLRSPDGTILAQDMKTIYQYSDRPGTCYTDECLPTDDAYVAVMTLVEQSLGSGSFQTHLAIDLPSDVTDFIQAIRDWMVELTSTGGFDLGADFEALATLFAPFTLDEVDEDNVIIAQYEVLIPKAIFDGCNNTFIATPEFDWGRIFSGSTFEDAMDDYNNGELRNTPAALSKAAAGDVVTIDEGVNAGSYVIDRVYTYKIYHGGSIVSTDPGSSDDDYLDTRVAYTFAVVTIKGEFPVAPLEGLSGFFDSRAASSLAVPSSPSFNVESHITTGTNAGDELGPWEVVQESFTWLFSTLSSAGFDVPSELVLNAESVLKSITAGFFANYQVGRPTAEQIVRMFFTEPTSVTTYGPRVCETYTWNEEATAAASVTGDTITLPIAGSEDLELELIFIGAATRLSLTETVTAEMAAMTSLPDLVDAFQELLDPEEHYIRVSGTAADYGSMTGTLTFSAVERGVGTSMLMIAEGEENGFRHFGFSDEEGGGTLDVPNLEAFDSDGYVGMSTAFDTTSFGFFYVEAVVSIDVGEELTITKTGDDLAITPDAVIIVNDPVFGGLVTVILFDPDSFEVLDPGDTPQITVSASTYDILSASSVVGINSTVGPSYFWLGNADVTAILLQVLEDDLTDGIIAEGITDGVLGAGTSLSSVEQQVATGITFDGDGMDILITVESEATWDSGVHFEFRTRLYDASEVLSASIDSSVSLSGTLTLTELFTLTVEADSGTLTATLTDSGASALAFEQAIYQNLGEAEDIASALNALNFLGTLGQFVAISSNSGSTPEGQLVLRTLADRQDDATVDTAPFLCFDADTAYETHEDVNWTGEGTSAPGEDKEGMLHPHVPTLFSVPAGTTELQFVASGTESPREVFPGATSSGQTLGTELPRDARLSLHYDDATSFRAIATDAALPAFVLSDVHVGEDFLQVFEQKILAEVLSSKAEALPEKDDRVVGVVTEAGSNLVQLLGTEDFTFLAPTSGLNQDTLRVGDFLFTEEGDLASGYQIIEIEEYRLTLDRPMPFTTGQIYRSGNEGTVEETDTFTDPNEPFVEDDVGRYLTISASNFPEMDGSYQILEVTDSSTVVLDRDGGFPVTETGLHWAVVRAPVDELGDSTISGFNEMYGLRPVRFYSGIPSEWRVVAVHPSVDRLSSFVTCTYNDAVFDSPYEVQRNLTTLGPVRGVYQPYAIIRRHTRHISATEMKGQGLNYGLYYADVRALSLGGDPVFNIPKDTPLTPLFGTYDSDGYRLEVEDSLFSYSSAEKCKIRMSPRFLPADLNDIEENKISLERSRYQVTHEFSSLVAQVQSLLLSNANRTLCADPLARHFLPSFVYVDIRAAGGDSEAMASGIYDFIDALEPEAILDVSQLERYLHSNDVVSYEHPVVIQIVTHDLDRRRVLTRSTHTIGTTLDEADFAGSHRTTFYIPGVPSFIEGEREGAERILIVGKSNG